VLRPALLVVSMALLSAAGCLKMPIQVLADANIAATATIPPVSDVSPVRPVRLPREQNHGPCAKVAMVDVDGLLLNTDMTGFGSLGENPVSLFREHLDAIAADPGVVAVVLRINTPGGGVTATDIMWHDLQMFKSQTNLPVVACLMDVGTGGGYYLATSADRIIAHPTSVVGGIGVILNIYNLQDAMAQFNIVATPIKAGKNIDLGSPIKALDEDRQQMLQVMADNFHVRFRKVVQDARPEVDAEDKSTFDGRVFTADEALQRRLVDSIGYLNDAIDQAADMSGHSRVTVTFYRRTNDHARSLYSVSPNVPLQGGLLPLSLPGLDRSRLPSFLYLWQPEPTMEKLGGK
jgi:protease-4